MTDLATNGCRMRSNAVGISRAESVSLDFGDGTAVTGKLAWSKGGALGISFNEPLDESVIERLNNSAQLIESDSPQEHQMLAAVRLASKSVH